MAVTAIKFHRATTLSRKAMLHMANAALHAIVAGAEDDDSFVLTEDGVDMHYKIVGHSMNADNSELVVNLTPKV
jgi:hypothetical protein